MKFEFVNVTKEEYTGFLRWLDENKNGYRYVPMPIADKTSVYHIDDTDYKNIIANRRFGGFPETYEIREEEYNLFKSE